MGIHFSKFIPDDEYMPRTKRKNQDYEIKVNKFPTDLVEENYFNKEDIIFGKNLKEDSKEVNENTFELLKKIGHGSFGQVYLVKHRIDGRLFALKILNKKKIIELDHTRYIKSERKYAL